jgi:hypothetical protein
MLSSMQPYSPHWSELQARQQQVHECVLQNQLLGLTFGGAASKDGWRSQQRLQQQRGEVLTSLVECVNGCVGSAIGSCRQDASTSCRKFRL